MGDTDDRIQKIETRLKDLEAQQKTVTEATKQVVLELRRVQATVRAPSASPAIDGTRLIERLDIIGGNLGVIAQKMD
jgi:hypothetical protein